MSLNWRNRAGCFRATVLISPVESAFSPLNVDEGDTVYQETVLCLFKDLYMTLRRSIGRKTSQLRRKQVWKILEALVT